MRKIFPIHKLLANALIALCITMPVQYLMAQDSVSVLKLPLEILRATGTNDMLVIYLTGDGGWNKFSQDLAALFVAKGYSLVALNSRKYFWGCQDA